MKVSDVGDRQYVEEDTGQTYHSRSLGSIAGSFLSIPPSPSQSSFACVDILCLTQLASQRMRVVLGGRVRR